MHYSTLILDLGDVLFHWSAKTIDAIPAATLKAVMRSSTWAARERGEISERAMLENISLELSLCLNSIRLALEQARTTLRVDHQLISTLEQIKAETGGLQIYAMTNITASDFAFLQRFLDDWSLFNGIFTSFEAKMRKPAHAFYEHVIQSINEDPTKMIFVDNKIDNVIAARSFGLTGIVFESRDKLLQQLKNLLQDPIERGNRYLRENAGEHWSRIENGETFKDAFSQFLILEATSGDISLVNLEGDKSRPHPGPSCVKDYPAAHTWNYFLQAPVGTTSQLPDDVDTTSYALLTLSPTASSANQILDRILANRNSDKLVQTYFDISRPSVDLCVCTNALRAFYKYNRGHELPECLTFVRRALMNPSSTDAALKYYSVDSFLFFVSLLMSCNPSVSEIRDLRTHLSKRLEERVGQRNDSLAVAMRVRACHVVGIWAEPDVEYLREMQEVDGGWELGWLCHFGTSRKRIGNRGVVTSYAVKALAAVAAKEKEEILSGGNKSENKMG